MNKEKIELLKDLRQLSSNIYKNYNYLIQSSLEMDYNNYNKYLKILKLNIILENNLYNNINNYETLDDLYEFIKDTSVFDYSMLPIYSIIDFDRNSLIDYRIYKKIEDKLINNDKFIINDLPDVLNIYTLNSESINYIRDITTKIKKEEIRRTIQNLKNDQYNMYWYTYINPIMEEELINNNFTINNNFNDSLIIDSKYDIFRDYLINYYGFNRCIDLIESLFSFINDPEFDIYDSESIGTSNFNTILCNLKANLLFIKDIDKFNKEYSYLLDTEKFNDNINKIEDLEEITDEEEERIEKIDCISATIENILDNLDKYKEEVNKECKIKSKLT